MNDLLKTLDPGMDAPGLTAQCLRTGRHRHQREHQSWHLPDARLTSLFRFGLFSGFLLDRLDQPNNLNIRSLAKILEDGVEQVD